MSATRNRQQSSSKAPKRRSATAYSAKSHDEGTSGGGDSAKLDKSGMYDLQQVKRLFDDNVVACLEDRGYTEAVALTNFKIAVGIIAIGAASYSQFAKLEFPESWPVLIVCVSTYFIAFVAISVLSYLKEGNAWYVAHLSDAASASRRNEKLAPAIWVSTLLARDGTSAYKLQLRSTVHPKAGACVDLDVPYELYITGDGELLVDKLRADVNRLVDELAELGKED